MIKTLKAGLESKHGNALIVAGLIGLVLSDVIPTPADAIYFNIERNLRDKWKNGKIQPKQYWERTAGAYYMLNPVWWSIVAGVTLSIKGDAMQKIKVMGGLIGVGAVLAVIYKNIKKDEIQLAKELSDKEMLANSSNTR